MKTWQIDISQLKRVGCTDLTITSNSRAADVAELAFRAESINAGPSWAFGDKVVLTDGEEVAFSGYVTADPDYVITSAQRGFTIHLENIVGLLDATPYTGKQSFDGIVNSDARLAPATRIISEVLNTGLVVPGGDAATETYSMSLDSTIKCPIGSGSQSCWSLINSCLHWIPDAVTWFNHETGVLTLRRADDGEGIVLDLANNRATMGDVELFTFSGYTSANFKARRDLQPPVVSLSWPDVGRKFVFPDGGNANQPWAFLFEVPTSGGGGNIEKMDEAQKQAVQEAAAQKMLVRGRKVPDGWRNSGNMKEAVGEPEEHRKFWAAFPGTRALAKTNAACLRFGAAIFEGVSLDEAYPIDEEEDDDAPGQPENYKVFAASDAIDASLYVHYEGSFPASSKKRDNVSGLKFCKGVLKQYVWLAGDYVGELSKEKWMEFFSGSAKFDGAKTRYALLTLECTFINRRRKVYKTGTNETLPGDEDYSEEENGGDEGGGGDATTSDYLSAAEGYFNATRKLFYDGAIMLHGVTGYLPSKIDSSNLSLVGGRTEWEQMNTPIVRAEWNPAQRTLEISTGSPEILTIDERIQRQQLGRQSSMGAGTSFAQPSGEYIPPPDGEDESSGFPMVSPSVTASASVTKAGRPLNPLELYYDEDGRAYINEGSLYCATGIISFPTTEVTELLAQYERVAVGVDYSFTEGKHVARIFKYGKR